MTRIRGIKGVPNPQIPDRYGDRDLPQGISRKPGLGTGYRAYVGKKYCGTYPTLREAQQARKAAVEEYNRDHKLSVVEFVKEYFAIFATPIKESDRD